MDVQPYHLHKYDENDPALNVVDPQQVEIDRAREANAAQLERESRDVTQAEDEWLGLAPTPDMWPNATNTNRGAW